MAIRYKKKQITLCFDKENKVQKCVAANVLAGSIKYDKLCNEVTQRTGIHRGLVDTVLKGVEDTMIAFLEEGFSVKLGEFASFRPGLSAKGQDNMEKVDARTISRVKIVFTPGSQFKLMLANAGIEQFDVTGENSADNKGDGGGGSLPGGGNGEAPDPAA